MSLLCPERLCVNKPRIFTPEVDSCGQGVIPLLRIFQGPAKVVGSSNYYWMAIDEVSLMQLTPADSPAQGAVPNQQPVDFYPLEFFLGVGIQIYMQSLWIPDGR